MSATPGLYDTDRSCPWRTPLKYQAVLFDLDGTLLDTLEDIADAMNNALHEGGYPTHPLDRYRTFIGDGVRMLATRALPEDSRDERTIDAFTARMRSAYEKTWNVKTGLFPGINDMLDTLVARNVRLSVLSNKPDDFTKLCVKTFLDRWHFAVVMGHHEAIPLKPSPDGALAVANLLGMPPDVILYVGDSGMDMETAVRAGMYPVGVSWGFRSTDELRESGAAVVIDTPSQLLEILTAK